jgi:hypothetical protein
LTVGVATAPSDLLRLLLDVDRLAVAGALAAGPGNTDDLVMRAGRDRQTVLTVIGDLRAAGLVIDKGDHYELDVAALRDVAQLAADRAIPMDPIIGYGMTDEERDVLSRLFSGRTLDAIPTNRAKRQIVLQRLALEFDVGRHYTEREVNAVLFEFHPDWSALRRYLVEEGFLDRAHQEGELHYWRSGGRVIGVDE